MADLLGQIAGRNGEISKFHQCEEKFALGAVIRHSPSVSGECRETFSIPE